MKKEHTTVHLNKIGKSDEVGIRSKGSIPDDYHCSCQFCQNEFFMGELFPKDDDRYYSNLARYSYLPSPNKNEKHICPGHWHGYRFAIQNLSSPGGVVYDPTVGSGTTIIEAVNNGRFGMGIELEFGNVTTSNLKSQDWYKKEDSYLFLEGNALNQKELIPKKYHGKIDLVLNGTPYPTVGGSVTSDAPQRRMGKEKDENFIVYKNDDNIGNKKDQEYWEFVGKLYNDCVDMMSPNGHLVIIIKDMMHKKKPYLLHEMIGDSILKRNPELSYKGFYVHKHIPYTMFMNTYPKRFPEIQIPLYQAALVFQKVDS